MKKLLPVLLALISYGQVKAQTNYALTFNGMNQYVSIGSPIAANSSYTKMAWVYATNTSGNHNIISSLHNPFWIAGGRMCAGNSGSYQVVLDPSNIPLNRWVHVAVTYDYATTTMRLYRDGVQVAVNTSSPAGNGGAEFIGSHAGTASYFTGRIDEVKIWTRAITPAEVKQFLFRGPANSSSGLVRYYKFDDGSGTTLTNQTGSNHGTLQNLPSWVASPVQYSSNAIQLDGANDVLLLPHLVSGSFTLEYWMRSTATGGSGAQWFNGNGIVDAEVGGQTNDWGTALVGSKLAFGIGQSGNDRTIFSTSDVNTGNWTHVAVSWNQSTGAQRLYINGTLEATGTASTNLRNAPSGIAIGRLLTGSAFFNGSIDDIRFWNTVRTDAEIQNNRSNQIDPASQPNLVSYYSFNMGIANGSNTGFAVAYDEKGANNGSFNNFSLSGSSSNLVAQNISLITLPVQWKAFTASLLGGKTQLSWITSSEENTRDFQIEHSIDNRNWTVIGTVAAQGNSNTERHYQHDHLHPTKGSNFYRIVQFDLDGRRTFSAVRHVQVDAIGSWTLLEQPVRNQTLRLQATEAGRLSLFNSNGALLLQAQLQEGINQIKLPSLAAGVYYLQGHLIREKLLIQ